MLRTTSVIELNHPFSNFMTCYSYRMAHEEIKFLRSYGKKVFSLGPLIIGFWLFITAILNLTVPQLEKTIADKSVNFFPQSNHGIHAIQELSREFQQPASSSMVDIIFVDKAGISAADNQYYQRLIHQLSATAAGKKHIAYLLDIYGQPAIRNAVTSKDKEAFYLNAVLNGDLGSSQSRKALEWLKNTIHDPLLDKPTNLQIAVTGGAAIFINELNTIDQALLIITIVSVVLIMIMLLIAYRSFITSLIPLINIGLSLSVARAIISFLGQHNWIAISSFSSTMSTAVVLGVATDYAVFLIGRYQEERRKSVPNREALSISTGKVSSVIIASGLTIACASYSMVFMQIGLFRTAGPPIAVGVLVTLLISLTFCPAIMSLAIRFNFLEPNVKDNSIYWQDRAKKIIKRPVFLFFSVLAFLLLCSSSILGMKTGFVENKYFSPTAASNRGLTLNDQHFLPNTPLQEYFILHADHDMRNTQDLAAIELASQALLLSSEVAKVQSITRPNGQPLAETTPSYQAGIVGKQLQEGISKVQGTLPLFQQLTDEATELNTQHIPPGELPLLEGKDSISSLAQTLINITAQTDNILKKTTHHQLNLHILLIRLHNGAEAILDVIRAYGQPGINAVTKANNFLQELDSPIPSLHCSHDLGCMKARGLFRAINNVTHNAGHAAAQALSPIPANMNGAYNRLIKATPELMQLNDAINSELTKLGKITPQALKTQVDTLINTLKDLEGKMNQLQQTLQNNNASAHTTPHAMNQLVGKLQEAASFLTAINNSTTPKSGGYFMPPQGFSAPAYVQGSPILISPDGKTTRIIVTFTKSPFDPAIFLKLPDMYVLVHNALKGTPIESATITSTGEAGIFLDFKKEVRDDTILLATISITAVLIILMILLRCILAPVIVMLAVLLSFAVTIGISVCVSQYIFGIPLHWSVIPITLMIIVAVGSDYSMLFVSRIRDEVRQGFNQGLISAFETTGSVITTAGIVFAVTMFALLAGGAHNLQQIGFSIGVGLIIDIIFVRTVLVPALLIMLQEKAWWPAKPPESNSPHET